MPSDIATISMVSLMIAVISLDQTAIIQVMVSQPLVGGWLLGLALGDPVGGLFVGTLLQFLSLTELPVGASIPPDKVLASLIGTGLYLLCPRPPGWSDAAFLGLIVVLFMPLAYLSRAVEVGIRRGNRLWTRVARSQIEKGHYRAAQLATLGGVVLFFLKGFIVSWVVLWTFSLWGGAGMSWGAGFPWSFELLAKAVPFVGLAAVVAGQRRRWSDAVLTAGLCLGMALSWYVH